ncbi:MAG: YggT family protein [Candidatus Nitricoxidivorans perseverans]|uniref:YggT family protein n=1 Tax=Candidatus Nitricoxidivorans perseverans TaxID=2975601 RepID=A0AA49FJH8_9PROT|nr:MAG: YggT family protein [Candidatus Nitricoxidivorans perseverans]
MLAQILSLVVGTVVDLFCLVLLVRFVLQWARVSFRNPVGQFVIAVTDWAVRPARKAVPGLFGLDLASLLLAWLGQFAWLGLAAALSGVADALSPATAGSLALAALVEIARLALYLAMGIVIVSALLSWINPYAPLAPLFDALSRPLLRPFRRLIPPIGGVDLSPLALLLLLQVLLIVAGSLRFGLLPWIGR